MMLSMETESVQTALCAPLPPLVAGAGHRASQYYPTTDDEQLSDASILHSLNSQQVLIHAKISVVFSTYN